MFGVVPIPIQVLTVVDSFAGLSITRVWEMSEERLRRDLGRSAEQCPWKIESPEIWFSFKVLIAPRGPAMSESI